MNPSSLVVPLDLAKRLKDAGFPQDNGVFYWYVMGATEAPDVMSPLEAETFFDPINEGERRIVRAMLSDELLAELPPKLKVDEYPEKHLTYRVGENDCFLVGYGNYEEVHRYLPSALALLWLWWKEWSKKEERT